MSFERVFLIGNINPANWKFNALHFDYLNTDLVLNLAFMKTAP